MSLSTALLFIGINEPVKITSVCKITNCFYIVAYTKEDGTHGTVECDSIPAHLQKMT